MSVGMVPTMGALHRGHMSLVERALAECDRVVVSIFVNPRQFGPQEDYARYPRPVDDDVATLATAGVHAVFCPSVDAMYPAEGATSVHVGGPLGERLEAVSRPGHFDGVALVVTKLLTAARPDRAYFGQKDAQQCAVVQRLARDLDTGVQIIIGPTVRDPDGLALSSRNAYLSPAERRRALAIPRGLSIAAQRFYEGEKRPAALVEAVESELRAVDASVDYVALVDPTTFADALEAGRGCEILVAARIGSTRLIDVLRLGMDEAPCVIGGGAT